MVDNGGSTIDVFLGQRNYQFKDGPRFERKQPPAGSILRSQLARFIGDANGDGYDDVLFFTDKHTAFHHLANPQTRTLQLYLPRRRQSAGSNRHRAQVLGCHS
jgi:hypothetical protein